MLDIVRWIGFFSYCNAYIGDDHPLRWGNEPCFGPGRCASHTKNAPFCCSLHTEIASIWIESRRMEFVGGLNHQQRSERSELRAYATNLVIICIYIFIMSYRFLLLEAAVHKGPETTCWFAGKLTGVRYGWQNTSLPCRVLLEKMDMCPIYWSNDCFCW